jgi:hypothetical protein
MLVHNLCCLISIHKAPKLLKDNAATQFFDKFYEKPSNSTHQHSVLLSQIHRDYDEMSHILFAGCV